MELILAGLGMVACLAFMMLVIPMGARLARRLRRGHHADPPGREVSAPGRST